MKKYRQIIFDLENELSKMNAISDNILDRIEYVMGHCRIALDYMRDAVVNEGFSDKKSEINFFKKQKPIVYSKLLYYHELFEIESTRQETSHDRLKTYLIKKLDKVIDYMKQHKVKVQYYKCKHEHLDEKYFLRGNDEIPLPIRNHHYLMDEEFFTWHDHTFSQIIAKEISVFMI